MKSNGLILILSMFLSMQSIAQTNFVFAYDDSGNRTSRSISVTQIEEKTYADTINKDAPTELTESGLSVNIFPNPTKGILKVETSFTPEGSIIEVILYNIQGDIVYKKKISESDEVDISDQPDGVYILNMKVSDYNKNWKIVKNTE